MPGRMGGQQHTVQNLRVLRVDDENGLVVVNGKPPLPYWGRQCADRDAGCVSGPKGCLVKIQDALLKPWPKLPEPVVAEAAKNGTS